MQSSRYCRILIKLYFSGKILEKCSNITFHENPFHRNGEVPCGRTDGHDEANSRFSQFHNVCVCQSDPQPADSITGISS
jgi:hypothetical protein